MQRITRRREVFGDQAEPTLEIKRKIFEKLLRRMKELGFNDSPEFSSCIELNPDVIVISDDQSFLFEPQNERALRLLSEYCGVEAQIRERIRVHPCKSRQIIAELKASGISVSGER